MLKPIAAGLMCFGVVTLGVAAFGAQDDAQEDGAIVIEGQPEGRLVPANPANREKTEPAAVVEIRIGDDGEAVIEESAEKNREAESRAEEVIVKSRDGKVVETSNRTRQPKVAVRFVAGAPAIDPGTRDALGKLIAGLKEEAMRLEAEGKKEESARKRQSIQAVEQLLNPGPLWGAISNQPAAQGWIVQNQNRIADETKRLQAQLEELRSLASKPQEGEAHARTQQEIADLQSRLAERQRQLQVAVQQPGAPLKQPGPGTPAVGQPQPGHGGFAYAGVAADAFAQWAGGSPEAATLMRKSHALIQAAHQLQQAGLEAQSRDLAKQAETLRAEADKIRAQASIQRQGQGGSGGGIPGGHPMELQRSLHELHEQIQQLRKEIGELRELLQQTRK